MVAVVRVSQHSYKYLIILCNVIIQYWDVDYSSGVFR